MDFKNEIIETLEEVLAEMRQDTAEWDTDDMFEGVDDEPFRFLNVDDDWHLRVFRPEYRELDDHEKQAIQDIKVLAAELLKIVDRYSHDSRCACLARTRLEEAVMWATKSIS
jgi:hypothetical protein